MLKTLFLCVALLYCAGTAHAFVEGLYCGTQNCYDVLGINRDTSRGEMAKIYRKLARKYHPDVSKEEDAATKFKDIANAYNILRDEEQRNDYNYMLDNPEEAYYHYIRYYRRRLSPRIDFRIVLAITFTVVSLLQYWQTGRSYDDAVYYAMQNPKFRNQAMQIMHQEGLLSANNKKAKNKKSKDEKKKEEERYLKELCEDSIDIRGKYKKPSVKDVLWVQLLLTPVTATQWAFWACTWAWNFWVQRKEYGDEEKAYLTRRALQLTQQYWDALDDDSQTSYLKQELWVKKNLDVYNEAIEEEHRVKLAENNRHKMWRRYMKRGGPGQMTFMED